MSIPKSKRLLVTGLGSSQYTNYSTLATSKLSAEMRLVGLDSITQLIYQYVGK